MRRTMITALFASVMLAVAGAATAGPLLSYGTIFEANGYPGDGALLGWQFTANQALTVTHLGLFDDAGDGFDVSHPVGLFRASDGSLLTSGVIGAGAGDALGANLFRYVDVADATLAVGQDYVLAYFTSDPGGLNRDHMIASWDARTTGPGITLGYGRFESGASGLAMPQNVDFRGVYFVGPNALYSAVVPLPAAGWLFGVGVAALAGLRRRCVR